MGSLSKGSTFTDGVQSNAAAINNLVDNATVLPGIITDRGAVTPDPTDSMLVYDASGSALAKCTLQNLIDAFPADSLAANKSLRTLGTGAQQAVAGNDTRLQSSITGIRKGVSGGADTVAVPKDFYFTGVNITATSTIDCDSADLFYDNALASNKTYTVSNTRGGMAKVIQIFQNGHTVAFSGWTILGTPNTAGWNVYSLTFSSGVSTPIAVCSS